METLGSLYGNCGCGAEYDAHLAEVRFAAGVLYDVPQAICPNCGARVYKATVIERIEAAYAAFRTAPAG
jgi:hypothetical protein